MQYKFEIGPSQISMGLLITIEKMVWAIITNVCWSLI